MFNKKWWTEGWSSLIVAVVVALAIRWIFVEAYVIPSGSMLPTLLINDHIFVNKLTYGVRVPFTTRWMVEFRKPQRAEVIVFRNPRQPDVFFIKRVVGVPGDKISVQEGRLSINGEPLPRRVAENKRDFEWLRNEDFRRDGAYSSLEDYIHWEETENDVTHSILLRRGQAMTADFGPVIVPEGHLFVMGDNRDSSWDSRMWGFLPMENVLGSAMFVWLSCEETLPGIASFICNPLSVRWSRFFHVVH